MQVPADAVRFFGSDVTLVDAAKLGRLRSVCGVREWIDQAGVLSAVAQHIFEPNGRPAPVTSCATLLRLPSQRLYVLTEGREGGGAREGGARAGGAREGGARELVGLLKVGPKRLFHWHADGRVDELPDQLCVLDFFIVDAHRRRGRGLALFTHMLEAEGVGGPNSTFELV